MNKILTTLEIFFDLLTPREELLSDSVEQATFPLLHILLPLYCGNDVLVKSIDFLSRRKTSLLAEIFQPWGQGSKKNICALKVDEPWENSSVSVDEMKMPPQASPSTQP